MSTRIVCKCKRGYGAEIDGLCTPCRGYTAWSLKQYRAGKYRLKKVPPVSHLYWTESDWVKYIDLCGEWEEA